MRAEDDAQAPGLRLSGFGTLGAVHAYNSEGWGFRRDVGQPVNDGGTRFDTDSRVGVQANYEINPSFELVGQLQLKRRPSNSIPLDSVEWAFAAWRPGPDLTFRVGRVSPGIFLLSEYRSVGFAYTSVRPNVETYGRLPVLSVDGADIAKSWDAESARWTARLFVGGTHARVPNPIDGSGTDLHMKGFIASIARDSAGLVLRATVSRFETGITPSDWKVPVRQALAQVAALPLPAIAAEARSLSDGIDPNKAPLTYFALGALYDRDAWIASAEAVHISSRLSFIAMNTGYVLLGHRFGPYTPYAMAGYVRSTRSPPAIPQWTAALTPVVGAQAAAGLQAAGAGAAASTRSTLDQRSASAGVRWDVQPQIALKLQWDRIIVHPVGGGLWGRTGDGASHANVVTGVMDFVF